MRIESYRDLRVWQAAMDLAVKAYSETSRFPTSEQYGLTSQVRRSMSSVAANIAEGYGRESTKSYVHFLKTARGSLKEFETHMILASRIKLLPDEALKSTLDDASEIGRMLNALIRSLELKLPSGFSED